MIIYFFILLFLVFSESLVFFLEEFADKRYILRWSKSIDNIDKQGNLRLGYGSLTRFYSDGKGLKTENDYRYYLFSRKMKRKYSNKNKSLVIQLQVMFPALMECGGAYIKILGANFEPRTFASNTPYKIMFGPDVCGFAFEDRFLKVILNYKGKYYKINQIIRYHISHIPQLFALILRPDNTYEISINMTVVAKGNIGKDFRMIRPKMIKDKKAKPPKNWDENEFIVDDNYKCPPHINHELFIVNPEYYVNVSKFDTSKGLPYINNPLYMRPWHPPVMKNPRFKGRWIPPLVYNPNYNINDEFYLQTDLGGVGIDIWQMSSGVIYDNILVTDNEKFAKRFAKEKWKDIVDIVVNNEQNSRPMNETMVHNDDQYGQNDNENHHEHIDDTGQQACYNRVEALKNTVFGITKEQIKNIMDDRYNRMLKIKETIYSQLSLLPKYSFFDPRYFNGILQPNNNFNLNQRLKEIESRRLTDTVKFVRENGLELLK